VRLHFQKQNRKKENRFNSIQSNQIILQRKSNKTTTKKTNTGNLSNLQEPLMTSKKKKILKDLDIFPRESPRISNNSRKKIYEIISNGNGKENETHFQQVSSISNPKESRIVFDRFQVGADG